MTATTIHAPTTAPAATIALADSERQRCEVWTRVMGYHRPVSSFNTGKKGEFHERLYFEERRCDDQPRLA
ncbi:anaerobic ribonucleoside-triphosphate reductase [Aquabacterium humicola]|uniref:anaerobic ribonucleoside-triphosphate reductase n=1 Tax=Aquabacterium humicola TaxID=3237377 RepID=UPI002543735F|nr:anaerobic ribonucleoside-triphosphate reductase [Rubrivivax pictus]